MKGINKQTEPESFTLWKSQANEDWQPSYDKLQNPEKSDVRTSLVEEQGYLCAYCCCQIENDTSIVIEHFHPQTSSKGINSLDIDYDNLFACCDGTKIESGTNNKFFCCDETKKDIFQSEEGVRLIKPTLKDELGFICEQAFFYTIEGAISPKDTEYEAQAKFTIDLLQLDNRELRKQRKEACAFLFDADNNLFDFTPKEFETIKNTYCTLQNNRFEPYSNAVLYFLNTYY